MWDRLFPVLAAGPWPRRMLDLALTVPAALILTGWTIIAIVRMNDRYEVGHGQGAWMALARHVNVAGLYPELFDGTSYGGTRHMPLSILLHAALARLTGEYLTSGKLLGLLATAALVSAVFGLLRSLGCRKSWALSLTASIIGGYAGLRAGTTIGGEPLPVLFGIAALTAVIRRRTHPVLMLAAVLVALGVSAKLNALWAPVAIATWLWVIERRLAAVFAVYAAISCVALLGALNVVSDGRMLENLVATSGAGVQGAVGFLKAPARMLGYLVTNEPTVSAFVPVMVYAGATRRWPTGALSLPFGWLAAAGLLLVVYADIGTGPNQFLDLAALTAVCVGSLVAAADPDDARERMLVIIVAAILVWSGITSFVVRIRPPLQDAVIDGTTGRNRYPRNILADQLRPGLSALSEDPGLLTERGLTPVVLDAFMLRRLADTHPTTVEHLVGRIDRQQFDLVVLVVELRNPDDGWWRDYDFGTRVMTAVARRYQFQGRRGPYYLYVRRPP